VSATTEVPLQVPQRILDLPIFARADELLLTSVLLAPRCKVLVPVRFC